MGSSEVAKTDHDFAAEFFDETWALLGLTDRSKDQNERMIHCCHAAYYHLDRIPDISAKLRAKGYWQIARVYAAVGQGVIARTYAFRCMDEARVDGDPFLLTIACEVLGRAAAVLGDGAERDRLEAQGAEYASKILDPDVRAFCEDNLAALPSALKAGPNLPMF
jgi:hypothetical protein